jgi:CIC family chloride channel protein
MRTLESAAERARSLVQRHWQRLLRVRERLRLSEEAFHLLLASGVGVIGGLINLVFFLAIEQAQSLALQHTGDLAEVAEHYLSPVARLIIPAVGGLGAGLVLFWGLRLVGPQRTGSLLEAVVVGDGRLPFRSGLVKALSSLVSISTGASIGREGMITQLTAMLASKTGQLAQWHPYRLRMLVACGAAAGIAAAYNAPIGGSVFAAQIVLGNFSMNLFAPLLVASVVATMVSRSFFGIRPWYEVPPLDFTLLHLPWFLVLGFLSGVLGAAFQKAIGLVEGWFARRPWPVYVRLALAGLGVGVISFWLPQVWGNGYSVTNRILDGVFPLRLLALIFLAKLLATVVTVGAGTVGGVFTPTLFLGASLGSVFGTLLHEARLVEALPTGGFALVGMASVLAATTHSPLLAMITVFEISLNHTTIPALMVACAMATLVARKLHPASIYTEALHARGLAPDRESPELGAATQQTVGDLMRAPVPPLRETATLPEIAQRFLTSPNNFLPVVDGHERLVGVVALHDLKEFLNAGQELRGVIAADVMRPTPLCLTPDQRLLEALPALLASELRNVPVVNNRKEYRLVGTVARADVLGLLSEALAAGPAPSPAARADRR